MTTTANSFYCVTDIISLSYCSLAHRPAFKRWLVIHITLNAFLLCHTPGALYLPPKWQEDEN
jgi:hypothetical protein